MIQTKKNSLIFITLSLNLNQNWGILERTRITMITITKNNKLMRAWPRSEYFPIMLFLSFSRLIFRALKGKTPCFPLEKGDIKGDMIYPLKALKIVLYLTVKVPLQSRVTYRCSTCFRCVSDKYIHCLII